MLLNALVEEECLEDKEVELVIKGSGVAQKRCEAQGLILLANHKLHTPQTRLRHMEQSNQESFSRQSRPPDTRAGRPASLPGLLQLLRAFEQVIVPAAAWRPVPPCCFFLSYYPSLCFWECYTPDIREGVPCAVRVSIVLHIPTHVISIHT